MFWASLWDSKFSSSKLNKQDYLIRKYIKHIINEKISSRPLFLTDFSFNKWKNKDFEKFNLKIFKDLNIRSFSKYIFRINKLPNYISKIRIIRFQRWLIIYLKIFTPNPLRKIAFKKKTHSLFKYFSQYYLISLYKRVNKFEF
jgi:hypothetical protein